MNQSPDPTEIPPPTTETSEHPSQPVGPAEASLPRRMLPRVIVGIVLAVIVFSVLTIFADVRAVGDALAGFDWWLLLPILGLTLFNYALRIIKWEVYLGVVNVPKMSLRDTILTFLSAFSMSVTPGKVGEVIKAVYVNRLTGAPVSRTAAVVAAERVTDALAMLGLAAIGFVQFSYGRPLLLLAAILGIAIVALFRQPLLLQTWTHRLERLPFVGVPVSKIVHHIEAFLDASNDLYEPKLAVGTVALSMVSWFGECAALFVILIGLGQEPTWSLLLVATFAHAVSSVFGALSMLPGGLGVAEASVAGLLLLLIEAPGFTRGDAAAATLLIRFTTLWFAVILGVMALAILQRQLRRSSDRAAAKAQVRSQSQAMEPS